MTSEKRGVQHLKTMAGLVDCRRNRTTAGALLELSMLAMEKGRLDQEVARAARRFREVEGRRTEIAVKSARLQKFVERNPEVPTEIDVAGKPSALQVHEVRNTTMRRRVLSY